MKKMKSLISRLLQARQQSNSQSAWLVGAAMVVLVAIGLRSVWLSLIPAGFNWDEVAYAYNGYALAWYGSDEYGRSWPLFLQSFGDYKPAFLSYWLAGMFRFLPATVQTARLAMLPLSLAGLLGVGLLIKKYRPGWMALLLVLFVSISPWHIHYSRAVMDPILGFSFFWLGWGLMVQQSRWAKWAGLAALALAMYTYNTQRLLVPLTLGVWILTQFDGHKQSWRRWLQSFQTELLSLGVLTFLLGGLVFSAANSRATDVFLLSTPMYHDLAADTVYRAAASGFARWHQIHTLPFAFLTDLMKQYFLHLQPDFLFFGESLGPRHSFTRYGLILPAFLPLIFLGLRQLWRRKCDALDILMLTVLLFTPGISALTQDVPHSGRTLVMVVPLLYFAGLGVSPIIQTTKINHLGKKVLLMSLAGLILGNTGLYLRDLYLFYPEESAVAWQEPMGRLSAMLSETPDDTSVWRLDLPDDPRIFLAWYNRLSPAEVHPTTEVQSLSLGSKHLIIRRYTQAELACHLLQENSIFVGEYQSDSLPEQFNLPKVATVSSFHRFREPAPYYQAYQTGTRSAVLTKLCGREN